MVQVWQGCGECFAALLCCPGSVWKHCHRLPFHRMSFTSLDDLRFAIHNHIALCRRKKPHVLYNREVVHMPDGGAVALDTEDSSAAQVKQWIVVSRLTRSNGVVFELRRSGLWSAYAEQTAA